MSLSCSAVSVRPVAQDNPDVQREPPSSYRSRRPSTRQSPPHLALHRRVLEVPFSLIFFNPRRRRSLSASTPKALESRVESFHAPCDSVLAPHQEAPRD